MWTRAVSGLPTAAGCTGWPPCLLRQFDHAGINAQLGGLLLPARAFLHHYDETAERRVKIANTIAALPIHGAIVVTAVGTHTLQERARARLMAWLLPHLQHVERVDEVVFESRSGGDRHDRRTAERLRRSRRITGQIRLRHGAKAQERCPCDRRRADRSRIARSPGSHDDAGTFPGSLPAVSADRPAIGSIVRRPPCRAKCGFTPGGASAPPRRAAELVVCGGAVVAVVVVGGQQVQGLMLAA